MSANTIELVALDNKELVDDELWNRLVGRIAKDENMELSLAERIMDQTLAFLALCAKEPTGQFSPSSLVDIGWHTFILYTKAYESFCEKVNDGQLIHHEPSDVEGVDYETGNIARTVTALRAHGFAVDEMLWENGLARCCSPNCHSE